MATDPTPSLADAIRALSYSVNHCDGVIPALEDFAAALLAEARKDQPGAPPSMNALSHDFVAVNGLPSGYCVRCGVYYKAQGGTACEPAAPSPEPAPLCDEAKAWRERALESSVALCKARDDNVHGGHVVRAAERRVESLLDEAAAAWSAEKREVAVWHQAFKMPQETTKQAIQHVMQLVQEGDKARAERDELRARLELAAGSIRASIDKRDDAPMSASSHLDEAMQALADYEPKDGVYSKAAMALRSGRVAPTAGVQRKRVVALFGEVVQAVAELPGRSSPDDWPEAMLVTGNELLDILRNKLGDYWP